MFPTGRDPALHHDILLNDFLLLLLFLNRYECLALIVVPVDDHYYDLQEQSDDHLSRKLVVGQTVTRDGHISIHLSVEEYQEQADQELERSDYRIQVVPWFLFLDTWEQSLEVGILVQELLDVKLSLVDYVHVHVLLDLILFKQFLEDFSEFFLVNHRQSLLVFMHVSPLNLGIILTEIELVLVRHIVFFEFIVSLSAAKDL